MKLEYQSRRRLLIFLYMGMIVSHYSISQYVESYLIFFAPSSQDAKRYFATRLVLQSVFETHGEVSSRIMLVTVDHGYTRAFIVSELQNLGKYSICVLLSYMQKLHPFLELSTLH